MMNAKDSRIPVHVEEAIHAFVAKMGMREPELAVSSGSRNGDSYSGDVEDNLHTNRMQPISTHRRISRLIINGLPKAISVIAKVAPTTSLRRSLYNSSAHFQREKYVFDMVLPMFEAFQKTCGLHSAKRFAHYPSVIRSECCEGYEYILQRDLMSQGYRNFPRTEPLAYDDVLLVLTHLAQFHAISFAMQQQAPEVYATIVAQLQETIFVPPLHSSFVDFLQRKVDYAIETLRHNPEAGDGAVGERLCRFRDEYGQAMIDCVQNRDDTVICHGDCWISNILYRPNNAKELKFLDWQVARSGTPAIDLSYFIFCCTDSELRERLPELLRKYHSALVRRMEELGISNGRELFPFERLQMHMKKYARFGFGMALMTLHSTCCVEKDLPNVSAALETTELVDIDKLAKDMLYNPAYIKRMSGVCRDMVRLGYL
ncbi:AGAP013267-PA-like protein [Anopheles sinensis]|uniref:AGAP013267-PA-like protein n=1 Tax=Anopheles sinensis TaxID=74873 RepID=A0A084WP21_ANOSI|nr:AGAP013267-PA-like protein [Anopheles sinensis]